MQFFFTENTFPLPLQLLFLMTNESLKPFEKIHQALKDIFKLIFFKPSNSFPEKK